MPTVFTVRTSANKGSFSVFLASESPLVIKAGIPEEPAKGRANRTLLSSLEQLLGCSVSMLSGASGRKKTLAADCTKEEFVKKIGEYANKQR